MGKISNNKIPFGLKNGNLVEVSEVESGLACGCVCPSCHRKLQANKGPIVSHYFSHDPLQGTQACESAFETAIHLMAKQILSEKGSAFFPELSIKLTQSDANGNVHEEKRLIEAKFLKKFDRVELEKRLGDIRPDIIAYQGGVPFLIEVAVTNFSGKGKIDLIRAKSLAAIEIDLSKVSYRTTKEELRRLIIEKDNNKKWLSNPTAIEVKRELKAELDEKIRKINEGIYRDRQKSSSHNRGNIVLPKKKPTQSNSHQKSTSAKQYDPRWFVCEACNFVFKAPLKDAPYTIETIQCPECDHAISTKPSMV
jgi:hypothetical protein